MVFFESTKLCKKSVAPGFEGETIIEKNDALTLYEEVIMSVNRWCLMID